MRIKIDILDTAGNEVVYEIYNTIKRSSKVEFPTHRTGSLFARSLFYIKIDIFKNQKCFSLTISL